MKLKETILPYSALQECTYTTLLLEQMSLKVSANAYTAAGSEERWIVKTGFPRVGGCSDGRSHHRSGAGQVLIRNIQAKRSGGSQFVYPLSFHFSADSLRYGAIVALTYEFPYMYGYIIVALR